MAYRGDNQALDEIIIEAIETENDSLIRSGKLTASLLVYPYLMGALYYNWLS